MEFTFVLVHAYMQTLTLQLKRLRLWFLSPWILHTHVQSISTYIHICRLLCPPPLSRTEICCNIEFAWIKFVKSLKLEHAIRQIWTTLISSLGFSVLCIFLSLQPRGLLFTCGNTRTTVYTELGMLLDNLFMSLSSGQT
jgi:hypothetical protein